MKKNIGEITPPRVAITLRAEAAGGNFRLYESDEADRCEERGEIDMEARPGLFGGMLASALEATCIRPDLALAEAVECLHEFEIHIPDYMEAAKNEFVAAARKYMAAGANLEKEERERIGAEIANLKNK